MGIARMKYVTNARFLIPVIRTIARNVSNIIYFRIFFRIYFRIFFRKQELEF